MGIFHLYFAHKLPISETGFFERNPIALDINAWTWRMNALENRSFALTDVSQLDGYDGFDAVVNQPTLLRRGLGFQRR